MQVARLWSLVVVVVIGGMCLFQYYGFDGDWLFSDSPIISSDIVRDLRGVNNASTTQPAKPIRRFAIPFHGVKSGAGLGNILFEIFAVIGIANLTNRIPTVNIDDSGVIGRFLEVKVVFPDLIYQLGYTMVPSESIAAVSIHSRGCCRFSPLDSLQRMQEHYVMGHGIYFQSHLYSSHMRSRFLELMNPSVEALGAAKRALSSGDLVGPVVCVHARRGDFLTAPHPQASDEKFTRHATQYILEQHVTKGPATVLFFSNDPVWMLSTFDDVIRGGKHTKMGTEYKGVNFIIPNTTSPHITLVISRLYCNVVLVTAPASTFAWFMAFLADSGKGKVFYSEHYAKNGGELEKQFVPKEFHLPHWIPLRMHDNLTFEQISVDDIQPY